MTKQVVFKCNSMRDWQIQSEYWYSFEMGPQDPQNQQLYDYVAGLCFFDAYEGRKFGDCVSKWQCRTTIPVAPIPVPSKSPVNNLSTTSRNSTSASPNMHHETDGLIPSSSRRQVGTSNYSTSNLQNSQKRPKHVKTRKLLNSITGVFKHDPNQNRKKKHVISEPTDTVHVLGYSKDGFDLNQMPPHWREIFANAGITEQDLKDKKTARYIMKSLGVLSQKQAEQKQSNVKVHRNINSVPNNQTMNRTGSQSNQVNRYNQRYSQPMPPIREEQLLDLSFDHSGRYNYNQPPRTPSPVYQPPLSDRMYQYSPAQYSPVSFNTPMTYNPSVYNTNPVQPPPRTPSPIYQPPPQQDYYHSVQLSGTSRSPSPYPGIYNNQEDTTIGNQNNSLDFSVQQLLNIDEDIVKELMALDIPEFQAQQAVLNTNNAGLSQAINWVLDNCESELLSQYEEQEKQQQQQQLQKPQIQKPPVVSKIPENNVEQKPIQQRVSPRRSRSGSMRSQTSLVSSIPESDLLQEKPLQQQLPKKSTDRPSSPSVSTVIDSPLNTMKKQEKAVKISPIISEANPFDDINTEITLPTITSSLEQQSINNVPQVTVEPSAIPTTTNNRSVPPPPPCMPPPPVATMNKKVAFAPEGTLLDQLNNIQLKKTNSTAKDDPGSLLDEIKKCKLKKITFAIPQELDEHEKDDFTHNLSHLIKARRSAIADDTSTDSSSDEDSGWD
jgi:hypothetical protein